LDELNIEIMRNTLYKVCNNRFFKKIRIQYFISNFLKAYLEDFYNFCKNIGGATAEVMCELLGVNN